MLKALLITFGLFLALTIYFIVGQLFYKLANFLNKEGICCHIASEINCYEIIMVIWPVCFVISIFEIFVIIPYRISEFFINIL